MTPLKRGGGCAEFAVQRGPECVEELIAFCGEHLSRQGPKAVLPPSRRHLHQE